MDNTLVEVNELIEDIRGIIVRIELIISQEDIELDYGTILTLISLYNRERDLKVKRIKLLYDTPTG